MRSWRSLYCSTNSQKFHFHSHRCAPLLPVLSLLNSVDVTNCMEKSPSWGATTSVTPTQELPNILYNAKVHCSVHKSPILSWINPVHTTLRSVLILFTHLHLGLPTGLFFLAFQPIIHMYSFICYMPCPYHPSSLDHSGPYLAKSTNYKCPRHAVFNTLLSPHPSSVQIFSSAPWSQTPSVYIPSLMSETKFVPVQKHNNIKIFTFLKSRREGKYFCTER
jgi:hypothetical protein